MEQMMVLGAGRWMFVLPNTAESAEIEELPAAERKKL